MNTMRPDVLVVVEFTDQIEAALERSAAYGQRCFFACTLPVAEKLRQAGETVYTPQSYTDDGRLQRYGEDSYEVVDRLCDALDDALDDANGELRDMDIRPFRMEHYRLKALCDGAVVRITELLDVLDGVKPKSVLAFSSAKTVPAGLNIDVDFVSLYGHDAERICRQRQIQITVTRENRRGERVRPTVPSVWQRLLNALLHQGWRGILDRIMDGAKARFSGARSGRGILVLQSVVPNGRLAGSVPLWRWRGEGAPILHASGRGEISAEPAASFVSIPRFADNPEIRAFFIHRNIDWFDYAEPYLIAYVENELPSCIANCRTADKVFGAVELGAVVGANLGAGSWLRHVASRARKAGVPVVVHQHGAIGFQKELSYYYQEFRFCSHYLVYAPGCMAHFSRPKAAQIQCKVVGSPSLDRVGKPAPSKSEICARYALDETRPLVVFPSVVHTWRNRQLIMATENEFRHAEIQNAILDALLAAPEVQIIVKGLPQETVENSPILRRVAAGNDDRVRYVADRPFLDFLDAADCFVMDMPSTMLLEAMTRDRRIYAFNQCYEWEEDGLALLDDGVHLERRSLLRFCEVLTADVRSGAAFVPRQRKGAFYSHYGDPFQDGKSTERVAEALTELTREGGWAA